MPIKIRPRSPQDSNRRNHQRQNGSTPRPGIASRASPGNNSHCRPSTMNSSSAVPRSTAHTSGGKGVAKAPMASERPAMAKARASRFLENLGVLEEGVSALAACLLRSTGGSVMADVRRGCLQRNMPWSRSHRQRTVQLARRGSRRHRVRRVGPRGRERMSNKHWLAAYGERIPAEIDPNAHGRCCRCSRTPCGATPTSRHFAASARH